MSIEVHAVQRARVWSESTFGADGTATLSNYTDVPAREGSMTVELTTASIDPQTLVQHIDDYRQEVLGPRSAKLTMTLNLAPTGTAAVTATSAVQGALGLLLKASMGGEVLAAGSTSSTGSTATVVNVQTGHGARWAAGGVLGWVNASGNLEVREIESVATDAITLKYGFSGAPSSTNAIYNAATYYLTQNPAESLQFIVYGLESEDRWVLLGGQLTAIQLQLDPTGKGIPSVQFTYEFASYLESDETAGTITGSIGTATYSNYSPIVGHVGDFRSVTVGASTYSTSHRVHASAISFTPKFAFDRYTSPSGVQTVMRWVRKRVAPVIEGNFVVPYQDLTWNQVRDARTSKAMWYQLGVTAGSTVLLSAPTTQIVAPQRQADSTGLAAQMVNWKGRLDGDVASSTTDMAKSAFRIHLC